MTREFLSLAHFVHRARVTALYRRTLRAVRNLEGSSAEERRVLWERVRSEYRKNAAEEDAAAIQTCMMFGEREAVFLEGGSSGKTVENTHGETWLTTPSDEGEDVRGRVGVSWPWQK